ncbi:helix-turn-helix domain-containing protein [bacterium]|jgi:predicted DNA-binding transcriptional regulator AlpA|nr:helix-turn-helix domain-containing protein [bacterium]
MEQLIFNIKEASAVLGISPSTLKRLTERDEIKKVRIINGRVGWTKCELERFVAEKSE